jgi:methylenetetrahydrofolate dehydrogenase (NADP+) / methenyltetrahydrofolate cyclohydrolase
MSATVLSGRELAGEIRARVAAAAAALAAAGTPASVAIVTATADEASAWYVRSIVKAAEAVGLAARVVDLGAEASAAAIHDTLARLSVDDAVSAIILQTPLPAGVPLEQLTGAIAPEKDIDGASPLSLGRLVAGLPAFAPATAEAVVALLDHHRVELAGRHVAVIGRSTVVGKPVAHLLLDRDATVTICHSRTRDLVALTRTADVVVAAAGRAGLVSAAHVTSETTLIDVATNPTADGGIVGDADAAVADVAAAVSPVPGGVGPVTTALLLEHAVRAARAQGTMSIR